MSTRTQLPFTSPTTRALALMAAATLTLAACGSSNAGRAPSTTPSAPAATSPTTTESPTTTIEPTTTTSASTTTPATTVLATTPTTEPATTTTLSLEQTIESHWQGTVLETIGGDTPAPGGPTVIYFLDGDSGTEVYWKTANEWCALSTFTWTVTDATSETAYSLDFQEQHHFDECLVVPYRRFVWSPTGTRTVDGRTVYDGNYSVPATFAATRTVCSTDLADPSPCGFPAALAAFATSPATTDSVPTSST